MYLQAGLSQQDSLEQGFIAVQGHDLKDILYRIGMLNLVHQYGRLLVRINPLVDPSSPVFLDEVWGVPTSEVKSGDCEICCLYSASSSVEGEFSNRFSQR